MKRITLVRCIAVIGLLATLGLIGYWLMVLGVRRCYFPTDSIWDILAIIIPNCGLAMYLAVSIRCGRFPWIMQKTSGTDAECPDMEQKAIQEPARSRIDGCQGTIKRKFIRSTVRILGAVVVVVFAAWIIIAQPSYSRNNVSGATVDPAKLRGHVEMLSQHLHPRTWQNRDNLDKCADYIAEQFLLAGATMEFQPFSVNGKQYRNVIGRFNVDQAPRVIVGAHYDVHEETPREKTPGADDNASGVAALIELAYLLGRSAPTSGVDLVAYTLEEPPFFKTESMGSAIHAKSLAGDKASVRGVIVLEMVGCFKDEWLSQSYPAFGMRIMYPSRGNFIAVVSRFDQGDWIRKVKTGMKGATDLPVYSIRAPAIVPGIDFSDHLNYWPYDIKAVMITDTAFYRNRAYHKPGDTSDRLDYNRAAKVVVAVFEAIKDM